MLNNNMKILHLSCAEFLEVNWKEKNYKIFSVDEYIGFLNDIFLNDLLKKNNKIKNRILKSINSYIQLMIKKNKISKYSNQKLLYLITKYPLSELIEIGIIYISNKNLLKNKIEIIDLLIDKGDNSSSKSLETLNKVLIDEINDKFIKNVAPSYNKFLDEEVKSSILRLKTTNINPKQVKKLLNKYTSKQDFTDNFDFIYEKLNNWDFKSKVKHLEKINLDDFYTSKKLNNIILVKINNYRDLIKIGSEEWCISKSKDSWNKYVKKAIGYDQWILMNFNKKFNDSHSMIGITTDIHGDFIHSFCKDNISVNISSKSCEDFNVFEDISKISINGNKLEYTEIFKILKVTNSNTIIKDHFKNKNPLSIFTNWEKSKEILKQMTDDDLRCVVKGLRYNNLPTPEIIKKLKSLNKNHIKSEIVELVKNNTNSWFLECNDKDLLYIFSERKCEIIRHLMHEFSILNDMINPKIYPIESKLKDKAFILFIKKQEYKEINKIFYSRVIKHKDKYDLENFISKEELIKIRKGVNFFEIPTRGYHG